MLMSFVGRLRILPQVDGDFAICSTLLPGLLWQWKRHLECLSLIFSCFCLELTLTLFAQSPLVRTIFMNKLKSKTENVGEKIELSLYYGDIFFLCYILKNSQHNFSSYCHMLCSQPYAF